MWNDIAAINSEIRNASLKSKIALGLGLAALIGVGLKFAVPVATQTRRAVTSVMTEQKEAVAGLQAKFKNVALADSDLRADRAFTLGTVMRGQMSEAHMAMDQKLIKQAWMDMEVASANDGVKQAVEIARRFGAEVFSLNSQNVTDGGSWANLSFAVEHDKLDALMAALEPLGVVTSRRAQTSDVTEQYVDTQSQLSNAERVRDRLVALLNTRTGKLSEILEAERELARITGTIESYKGRIRYLNAQTDRARLDIQLRETGAAPQTSNAFVRRLKNVLSACGEIFLSTISGLFVLIGFLLGLAVYMAFIAGIVILARRFYKRATVA